MSLNLRAANHSRNIHSTTSIHLRHGEDLAVAPYGYGSHLMQTDLQQHIVIVVPMQNNKTQRNRACEQPPSGAWNERHRVVGKNVFLDKFQNEDFQNLEWGPETIIVGISVKSSARTKKHELLRPILRPVRDKFVI